MTQVLYRKYRPQDFDSFSGQEHIIKTIKNEIKNDAIAHAYLFCGHRGTGKTSLARLFAKAINCQNRKGFEPCNECVSCKEINKGSAIDLIEIDAASNRGIDDVKSLRESIKYRPTLLKYKVLILDEAHQLSKDAANALLKILEEPPEYVVFILATTEAHKMIPTILSRCQRFDFHKLTIDEIVQKLEKIINQEDVKIDEDALRVIALSANGSLRDAEGILTQVINFSSGNDIKLENVKSILNLSDLNSIINFTETLIKKDIPKAIKDLNEEIEKGLNIEEFSKTLINYLRKLLILKIDKGLLDDILIGETDEDKKIILKQSDSFNEEELKNLLNLLLEAEGKRKFSSIAQLPLELALIGFRGL